MLKVRKKYRHPNCLDIDIEVRQILGEGETFISLIVKYWNRHMKCYQGRDFEIVSVSKKYICDWKEVE